MEKETYAFADGKKEYIGEWKDGSRNGKGTQTWPDGSKYEGEWKNDTFHGKGNCETYANGKSITGICIKMVKK